VSYSFPTSAPKQLGYEKAQVDQFVAKARAQYSDISLEVVTANLLRNTEFDLVNGGYEIISVDTAMDRLEDAFAAREINHQKQAGGQAAIEDRLMRITEIVYGRILRPNRKKFSNVGLLLRGYNRKQVDSLCEQVSAHLYSGVPLQLNVVRRAIFKADRGGYVESQVDAFIDRVIEILQIEKNR
jgi:DivIVA domain-containing protein